MFAPKFFKLLDETGDDLGVVGDDNVLVVPHHSSPGPVEGPVDQEIGVYDAELVVHQEGLLLTTHKDSSLAHVSQLNKF